MQIKKPNHPLFKAPPYMHDTLMLTVHGWVPDTGKAGLAFSGLIKAGKDRSPGTPIAVGPIDCGCGTYQDADGFWHLCPHREAGDFTCARFGVSNGYGWKEMKS